MTENILALIAKTRRQKNFSQQYMASLLNISQSYYNKIEKGKTDVTLKKVIEIAEILKLNLPALIATILHENSSIPPNIISQNEIFREAK